MPAVNEYLPLANNVGADVVAQADYAVSVAPGGDLQDGYKTGVAKSGQVNKTLRQATVMTAALAQLIVDVSQLDLLDDGNVAALEARLQTAFANLAWNTGDGRVTYRTVAVGGWVLMNDGTIGDAASGASARANADCEALFKLLWANITPAGSLVVGGAGGSANADWVAHKKITLPKQLGRAIAVAGAGAGLTARALGSVYGVETVALIAANNGPHAHGVNDPTHNHGVNDPSHNHLADPTHDRALIPSGLNTVNNIDNTPGEVNLTDGGGPIVAVFTGISLNASGTGISIQSSGTGTPHENMQPSTFWNVEIKL